MSRYINADALPRHGHRGGIVHWKDIAEAPSVDIVTCTECKCRCEGIDVCGNTCAYKEALKELNSQYYAEQKGEE